MSKVIEGVPESITRADYLSLIESVGLEPSYLRKLTFAQDGIHAVVFEKNESGGHVIDNYSGAVKHTVYIPVKD